MFQNLEYLSAINNQPLFHYTKLIGMEGIIKNKTIWLTHFKCLNDPKELDHMKVIYKKILEKENEDEGFKYYVNDLIKNSALELEENQEGIYIFSLTNDNNSKCMWKNYADGGVNIEFETPAEFEYFFHFNQHRFININSEPQESNAKIYFGKVYYNDDEIEKLVHDIYDMKIKKLTDDKFQYNNLFIEMEKYLKNQYMRFFKKCEKWSYEKEYRLVIMLNNDENVMFKHYKDNGSPYIKLCFNSNILLLKGININSKLDCSAKGEVVNNILNREETISILFRDLNL